MPTRFLLHTILLLAATAGIYVWITLPLLTVYTLQLVAALVILYLGSHWLKAKKPRWFQRSTITLDITILTCMILLLVTATGALTSPLFFLLYFLMFGVAMLYEIEATLVLTGVLILFFLFLPGTDLGDLAHLSELLALIMITPLAILFGHQYETALDAKRARAKLTKNLGREETDTLLFLSLNLKTTLISALDNLAITIPLTRVTTVRTHLQTLYTDLKQLYRSANELSKSIDHETDH